MFQVSDLDTINFLHLSTNNSMLNPVIEPYETEENKENRRYKISHVSRMRIPVIQPIVHNPRLYHPSRPAAKFQTEYQPKLKQL